MGNLWSVTVSYFEYAGKKLRAVSPSEPREKAGLYWGYSVRLAASFSAVFTECPFKVTRSAAFGFQKLLDSCIDVDGTLDSSVISDCRCL